MISGKDLNYFSEVAICSNLSRASERLGIAQPSLSASIKKLEDYIGTQLFIRQKTGVSLTPAGRRLFKHTQAMQQLWSEIKSEALKSHSEIYGSFKFGCYSSVGLYHIPHVLADLIKDNKNLELKIEYDLSRKIAEKIINMSII